MPEENPIKAGEQKIERLVKSEPWYVWAGAAAAAGVIVYFVWKRRQAASAVSSASTPPDATAGGTTAADAAQLNGFQVDSMAGLPFGETAGGYNYQSGPVDNYPGGYSEVGVNGQNVPIVPYGDTPIFDSNGNLIGWQQPNPNPTTSPAPPPTQNPPPPTTEQGVIRNRVGKLGSANGVPFVTKPGGPTLHDVAYGSKVTITGSPITGPNNNPKSGGPGSDLWFPVTIGSTSGYISAYDIINILTGSTTGTGSGGVPDEAGGFHLAVNAGRNTVDQWAFSNGMHRDFHSFAGEVN